MASKQILWLGAGAGTVVAGAVALVLSGRLPVGPEAGDVAAQDPDTPSVSAPMATAPPVDVARADEAPARETAPVAADITEDVAAEAAQAELTQETEASDGETAVVDAAPPQNTPKFDLVRVEPDGSTLIAGQAPAGAELAILVDGTRVGRATVGRDGTFTSFVDIAPAASVRVVTLATLTAGDAIDQESTEQVILAPQRQIAQATPVPEVGEDFAALSPGGAAGGVPQGDQTGDDVAALSDPVGQVAPEVGVVDLAIPEEETAVITAQTTSSAEQAVPPSAQDGAPLAEVEAVQNSAPQPVVGDAPELVVSQNTAEGGDETATEVATENTTENTGETTNETTSETTGETTGGARATARTPSAQAPAAPARSEAAVDAAATAQPAAQPAAPTVLLADGTGVRVLQSGGAPDVATDLALDAISYDAAGTVLLSGRAPSVGPVRIYLDNRLIKTAQVAQGGTWNTDLPDVDTGVYTLRLDQIDAAGTVTSRLETPFKREAAETLAEAPRDPTGAVTATVVPGSTLWAIAKSKYGEGVLFVRVFEANRDKIRDPDLIYPGQVFTLPN